MIKEPSIIDVNRDHVGDVDVFDVVTLPLWLVFRGEVRREAFLCFCSLALRASCGELLASVKDDPSCWSKRATAVAML
jgi:hypothetical protein